VSTSTPLLGGLRVSRPFPERTRATGSLVYRLITTTDHKVIGIMYVVACFTFFFVGGLTSTTPSLRPATTSRGQRLHVGARPLPMPRQVIEVPCCVAR